MAEEQNPPSPNTPNLGVKVFRLNEDGKWEDHGIGHVSVDQDHQKPGTPCLVVTDEVNNTTILQHHICQYDIYQKQSDTIITWKESDPEHTTELTLSFQEPAGRSYIWEKICNARRDLEGTRNDDMVHSATYELQGFPAIELSTLPSILEIVKERRQTHRLHIIGHILHDEFFQKLIDLFRICEEHRMIDSLHMLYQIMREIILLDDQDIFEKIFQDEVIMDIIGFLEYEPGVPHANHREFLNEQVVFREAIPITDPSVLTTIHQTYRISYAKDLFLLEEKHGELSVLNSMIRQNKATVVCSLKDDGTSIPELFARLKSSCTEVNSKKELVDFLHEFCTFSENLEKGQQSDLFRDFIDHGIIGVIVDVLRSDDKSLASAGTNLLILLLNCDEEMAAALRSYVIQTKGIPLLGLLKNFA